MATEMGYFDIKSLLTALIFLLITMATWTWRRKSVKGRLPPGPFPLPIIGSIHLVGGLPHRSLAALCEKYGPLMTLRYGSALNLVVSSPEMAKVFLKSYDHVFSGRLPSSAAKYLTYNSDLTYASSGPTWRQMRKLCVLELFHSKRIHYFRYIREEEVTAVIHSLMNSLQHPVNVTQIVTDLVTNIICRMALGRKYSDKDTIGGIGILSMVKQIFTLTGSLDIGDYIPYLAWMDLQGISRTSKKVYKMQDQFLEKIIDDHAAQINTSKGPRDIVDVLMAASTDTNAEFQPSRENIKGVILDILAAGTDTSSSTLNWTMAEILKNPPVMKKLQDELERVVGFDRTVSESDLPGLVYLQAVVKESLRLHPPAVLVIPHVSVEDCTVLGYQIPKGTRLMVNLWAIGRNRKAWGEDAESFKPERFLEAGSIDARTQYFEWIPFGAGRRGCPGQQLGLVIVEFAVAQLVHCFNWKLPPGLDVRDLDMTEKYALTVAKADQLFAVPTLRFPLLA